MKALSADFARELPQRFTELRATWAECLAHRGDPRGWDLLQSVHDIVHKFAGSGQHFGHVQLSRAAAPLDEFLIHRRKRKRPLADDETARIEAMIQEIGRAARLPENRIEPDV
ncbi:MAG: Hpt domain-containing protein [Rhodospirillaceae bacterium]|nr:Hpt domain-containing protein [Rhodospirillaceae bacterium]